MSCTLKFICLTIIPWKYATHYIYLLYTVHSIIGIAINFICMSFYIFSGSFCSAASPLRRQFWKWWGTDSIPTVSCFCTVITIDLTYSPLQVQRGGNCWLFKDSIQEELLRKKVGVFFETTLTCFFEVTRLSLRISCEWRGMEETIHMTELSDWGPINTRLI